jgi:CubicO group peptidase (beta-lactamase class C family)
MRRRGHAHATISAQIRSTRSLRVAAAWLAAAIPLVALPPLAAARQPATTSPDLAGIDRYVESEMRATGIPGVAVGIVREDRIVHLRGFGEADESGRPVTPDTPFIMASVGKSFTALAVMQLVEAGRVDLDAPVQRYLPWFRVADPAASARITVRHLLNQTSGLPTLAGLTSAYAKDAGEGALERAVRGLRTAQLAAPVGQTFQYCNLNYSTLGLVVQTVSGQRFEDYLRDHIFAPLDMDSSFASPEDAHRYGLATGHSFWFGRARATRAEGLYNRLTNRAMVPAGLISSSADDVARYLMMHLGGGSYRGRSILSAAGIAELHHPAVAVNETDSYAMGWVITEAEASGDRMTRTVWHDGGTGDFHAEMILIPESQWGVVLLMNGENGLEIERIERIADGVVAQLVGLAPPPAPFPESKATFFVLIAVLMLQVLAAIRSLVIVRRWRLRPARRPRGAWAMVWRVALPLMGGLAWALLALNVLPAQQGANLALLRQSDIGLILLTSGGIALLWSLLRTALVVLVLRSPGTQSPPPAELRARHGVAQPH